MESPQTSPKANTKADAAQVASSGKETIVWQYHDFGWRSYSAVQSAIIEERFVYVFLVPCYHNEIRLLSRFNAKDSDMVIQSGDFLYVLSGNLSCIIWVGILTQVDVVCLAVIP